MEPGCLSALTQESFSPLGSSQPALCRGCILGVYLLSAVHLQTSISPQCFRGYSWAERGFIRVARHPPAQPRLDEEMPCLLAAVPTLCTGPLSDPMPWCSHSCAFC